MTRQISIAPILAAVILTALLFSPTRISAQGLKGSAPAPLPQSAPPTQTQTSPNDSRKQGHQSQNSGSIATSIAPKLPGVAFHPTLHRTSPKILNPAASAADAAIIAVLQKQKTVADMEKAQMLSGAVHVPQPTVGPSHTMSASGANNGRTRSPNPGMLKSVQPPPSGPTPHAVLTAPLARTGVCLSRQSGMSIDCVSGTPGGAAVFTQDAKFNLYTIWGNSFGDANPGNRVYLYGNSFHQNFQIQFWSDDHIAVMFDPQLSGVADQDNLHLVVQRGDGKSVELAGFKFYAARDIVPVTFIPGSQVAFSAHFPNAPAPSRFSSPISDPSAPGAAAEVDREGSNGWAAQADAFDFSKLNPGFFVDSAQITFWYLSQNDCDGLVQIQGYKFPHIQLLSNGNWNVGVSGNKVNVDYQVQLCDAHVTLQNGQDLKDQFFFSRYAVTVWLKGPRGVKPWPSNMQ